MTTAICSNALQLYRKVLGPRRVRQVVRSQGRRAWAPLYRLSMLLWLMISQHLESPGTLAQSVGRAARGELGRLLPKRQRRRMSLRTGGYCRARQRLPLAVMKAVIHYLTKQLHKLLREAEPGVGRPIYIIDGSSLRLPHKPQFVTNYPPASNQHGQSHWPVMRVAVLHEARTGLATEVARGPMYGPKAVSEQSLIEQLLQYLVRGALILADRNFGIFATAFAVTRRGCDALLRLTKLRASALTGGRLQPGTEQSIVWRPSPWDRRQHPELPSDAEVRGRVLVCPLPGFREPLYLFTTLDLPAAEIVRLYGLRWNVETDLKSLKQTVHLQPLTVASEGMIEKDLLAAIAAYNLVRTVICLAAREANLHPRELSFTHVLYLVQPFAAALWSDADSPKARQELKWLLRAAATCTLPKRRHRRSFPRSVWAEGYRYPVRRASKCK
ncbi:MAG: IS4 family transposase [Chloroflexota bacterium]